MPNSTTYSKSNSAGNGMNSGIAYILLQDIRTILTKRANSWSALFTQLKAMYSAFIGFTQSLGNFVKMVYNGV